MLDENGGQNIECGKVDWIQLAQKKWYLKNTLIRVNLGFLNAVIYSFHRALYVPPVKLCTVLLIAITNLRLILNHSVQ
jgi:hypothetical protein